MSDGTALPDRTGDLQSHNLRRPVPEQALSDSGSAKQIAGGPMTTLSDQADSGEGGEDSSSIESGGSPVGATEAPCQSEFLERVARAIFDAENGLDGDSIGTIIHENFRITVRDGDKGLGDTMTVCRAAARAAIEAMRRRPLDVSPVGPAMGRAMLDAGLANISIGAIWEVWDAMIDAALSPRVAGSTEPQDGRKDGASPQ